MLQLDIDQDTVRKAGSHTRNLLRVKRGLDMVRVLFEQILASEYGLFLLSFLETTSEKTLHDGLTILESNFMLWIL